MRRTITSLDDHPNTDEIVDVMARMVDLSDDEITRLPSAWCNDEHVAAARSHALSPDSPLVLEALASFDSLAFLYADDLAGTAEYVSVPAPVTALALKAVRDAVAAAYAQPVLSREEHRLLLAPWRAVFGRSTGAMPDFGPQHTMIIEMLSALPHLACRSHDSGATERFESLLAAGLHVDPEEHALAFDRAWHAAITTRRRRLWQLATRSAHEAYYRRCSQCDRSGGDEDRMVLALCLGAVVGVLVKDVLDDQTVATLAAPAAVLVPEQRAG